MKTNSRKRRLTILLLLGLFVTGTVVSAIAFAATDSAKVSYVSGKVEVKSGRGGDWKPAKVGTVLSAKDTLKTGNKSKAEIKLGDGSVIRISPKSNIRMKSLVGGKKEKRDMGFKLGAGKVWANVSKAIGGDNKFEVETKNAVAGVRGTIFRIDSMDDESTLIKVYSGAVAVTNSPIYQKKGHDKSNRVQVPGPQPVSKKKWEELVAKSMQEIRVAANGDMSAPKTFTAEADNDEWVAWNKEMDAAMGSSSLPRK